MMMPVEIRAFRIDSIVRIIAYGDVSVNMILTKKVGVAPPPLLAEAQPSCFELYHILDSCQAKNRWQTMRLLP